MFKKILILVDDQPASMQAIRHGVEVARVNRAEILFFHLLPNFETLPVAMHEAVVPSSVEYEREVRGEASAVLHKASSMAEAAGVLSLRAMGTGGKRTDAECVADVAEKRRCELIVVGTDSRNAVIRLISKDIVPGLISRSKVPVLVCHSKAPSGKTVHRPPFKQSSNRELRTTVKGDRHAHTINE